MAGTGKRMKRYQRATFVRDTQGQRVYGIEGQPAYQVLLTYSIFEPHSVLVM